MTTHTFDFKNIPWPREFMASIVVFLVALPLCMAIAKASGVEPALGLVTGIIGGLVVGFVAGQPLQVSGPAAGLFTICLGLVNDFGALGLGMAVMIAGALQLAAGFSGLARWFRAVSPAVIQGMLAGIGVLIFSKMFHALLDDNTNRSGLDNLLSMPDTVARLFPFEGDPHHMAALMGIITIVTIVGWNQFRPKALKVLPGALMGLIVCVISAQIISPDIDHVNVPESLLGELVWVRGESFEFLGMGVFWLEAVGLALIASAETLLCATAVDRMHDGPRTNYDQELRGQGIGNLLCGVVGALPMTGVIVRSSANVDAGGTTRWSAIMHGMWLLLLVTLAPQVLGLIPSACLAGILVFTGYKLFNIPAAVTLWKKSKVEFGIWAATVTFIVVEDLLVGVLIGTVLALARLIPTLAYLRIESEKGEGNRIDLKLHGSATFVSLPTLAEALEELPKDAEVHFHLDALRVIDHGCLELIQDWDRRYPGKAHLHMAYLKDALNHPPEKPGRPNSQQIEKVTP